MFLLDAFTPFGEPIETPPPPWTPSALAHVVHRWRAKSITGLSDNDPVTTWNDLVGSAHLTSSGSSRPTYKANAGDPYLEFDGVDDVMSATVTSLNDLVHILVMEFVSDVGYDAYGYGITHAWDTWINSNGSLLFQAFAPGGDYIGGFSRSFPSGFMSVLIQRIGSAGKVRMNGNELTETVATTASGTTLGVGFHLTLSHGHVRFKEIIVCNAAFEAGEEALLAAYLNDEYGLTL